MIKKLHLFINAHKNKPVVKNSFYMALMQLFNYLIPLASLPYAVRVLGAEKFGLVSFAVVIVNYFLIFIDYGFNYSAVKKISLNRHDTKKLSEIFWLMIALRIALFLFAGVIFLTLVYFVAPLRRESLLYFFTFLTLACGITYLPWFFQGLEKMQYITYFGVAIKAIQIVMLFLFVKGEQDYILMPLITCAALFITGWVSLFFTVKKFKLKFCWPDYKIIVKEFKEGWHFFGVNMLSQMYNSAGVVVLGIFSGNAAVGYYSAAQKIIDAVKFLVWPLINALYPYIVKKFASSAEASIILVKKMLKVLTVVFAPVSAGLFIFAYKISAVFLGAQYVQHSSIVLKIGAIVPLAAIFSTVFTAHIMMPLNMQKQAMRIFASALLVNVLLNLCLVPPYSYIGTAVSIALTEIYIAICAFFTVKQKEKSLKYL